MSTNKLLAWCQRLYVVFVHFPWSQGGHIRADAREIAFFSYPLNIKYWTTLDGEKLLETTYAKFNVALLFITKLTRTLQTHTRYFTTMCTKINYAIKIINKRENIAHKEIHLQMLDLVANIWHKLCIVTNTQINTNIHSPQEPYPNGTVCQKHWLIVTL